MVPILFFGKKKFLLVLLISFVFTGCSNKATDELNYDIFFWSVVYNPIDVTGDYRVETEIDTVVNQRKIKKGSRSQLYEDRKTISNLVDSLTSNNAFGNSKSVTLANHPLTKLDLTVSLVDYYKSGHDSLFTVSTQVSTYYHHSKLGVIKVTYPHSGHPDKVFSTELQKIISKSSNSVDTLNAEPIITLIRKKNIEEIKKIDSQTGVKKEAREWY